MTPDLSNFTRIELADGRIFEPTPDGWRVLCSNVSVQVNETLVALDLAEMLGFLPHPDPIEQVAPAPPEAEAEVYVIEIEALGSRASGEPIWWRTTLQGGPLRAQIESREPYTPGETLTLTLRRP